MQTLDYRPPRSDRADARLVDLLRRREATLTLRLLGMLALGLLLSLLAPMAFASLLRAGLRQVPGGPELPWPLLAACCTMFGVPLLLALARREHGNPFLDELAAYGTGRPDSYGEFQMRGNIGSLAVYFDLFLLGPRLLLEGTAKWSERARAGPPNFPRAAEVIAQLHATGHGVEVRALRRPDEPDEDLRRTLAYLHLHDWIDVSADLRRTWLCSRARGWVEHTTS
jgi:hypothetical protein